MFQALGIEATTLIRSKNVSITQLPLHAGSDREFTSDFQSHFKEIAKQNSPEYRRYYVHLTTVVVCMRYDVMGISPLSTISNRTRGARRIRCKQLKTGSCVLAFAERTFFDIFLKSSLYDGCHDLLHHLYFHTHITVMRCVILIPIFAFLSLDGDGRDAVLDLHVY